MIVHKDSPIYNYIGAESKYIERLNFGFNLEEILKLKARWVIELVIWGTVVNG